MFCPQCGIKAPREHRFCWSCGTALPRGHMKRNGPKVSRWFWAIPVGSEDPPDSALRVSRYLQEYEIETEDGSVRIPSHHVRFSIWVEDHAVCAVSLPDGEAESLAQFLLTGVSNGNDLEPTPLG